MMADVHGDETSAFRESDRQNLMKHILDAVKQCQVRFGGKTELATEKDSCVQCLLVQFENAFLHGLRKGKVWGAISSLSEPFRQVTGKVLSGLPETEITFWQFIKEFMMTSEVHRLVSLNGINTDSGRCRAWLRSCLNENSLERTLVTVLSNKNLLRQYYEDWSLLLDEERSSTLPVMARGLGFIVFAIEIEAAHLNTQMKQPTFPRSNASLLPVENRGKQDPLPVIANRGESLVGRMAASKKKRKKKVNHATINDIEVPEDEPTGNHIDRNRPASTTAYASSSRSVDDVKSTVGNNVQHTEMIKKFTQSHRRATSLESSDLHKQRKQLENTFSASVEVAEISNARVSQEGKEISAESEVIEANNKEAIDIDNQKVEKLSDIEGNTEYEKLMSKLSNLSTSFKSSFSSGFLQRIGSKDTENADEKEASVASNGSMENLYDDENDVFTSSSKLEINDGSNAEIRKTTKLENPQPSVRLKTHFAVAAEDRAKSSSHTPTDAFRIPTSNLNFKTSASEYKTRSRNPSDSFDKILGQGDYFSPNTNSTQTMENALLLKTPPSTPLKDTLHNHSDKARALTPGLEERLEELRRNEDRNAVGLLSDRNSVTDSQYTGNGVTVQGSESLFMKTPSPLDIFTKTSDQEQAVTPSLEEKVQESMRSESDNGVSLFSGKDSAVDSQYEIGNCVTKAEAASPFIEPHFTAISDTTPIIPDQILISNEGSEEKMKGLMNEDKVEVGLSSGRDLDSPYEILDESELVEDSNSGGLKPLDDNAETGSVASSYTESITEDLDVMQPVGYESEKFSEMIMTFDRQSSQAANDALQLLKTSSEMHDGYEPQEGKDSSSFTTIQSGRVAEFSLPPSRLENDLSTADLKQAILATVKRKDEVEERNKVLQLAIDEEREYSLSVKAELDILQEKHDAQAAENANKVDALSRENEVLRNQLKKYVAAVQLLKRESRNISKETTDAIGTLRGYVDDSDVVLPPPPKERTESELDSIYEEKLIQMAELHGELMEFHESLQRELLRKQNQIVKMRDELIVLRGPLPNDLEAAMNEDRSTGQHRPLINIWIPSVFVKGKGSDAHNLYQVYIRIGDEEWNIYRRYSQFHKMHLMCCKEHQDVEKFNFPPKKILKKKDVKFVEGRRRKLQEYIRRLINLWITKNEALSESPNKENLEKALSFFGDSFIDNGKSKKENSKRKNTPVYSGL